MVFCNKRMCPLAFDALLNFSVLRGMIYGQSYAPWVFTVWKDKPPDFSIPAPEVMLRLFLHHHGFFFFINFGRKKEQSDYCIVPN